MTKKFQLKNDGVLLHFSKAFDVKTNGLKKKLWNWYLETFQFTRCEFDKELNYFKVFFCDSKAVPELQGKILRHFASGDGIDLTIFLTGSAGLIGKSENFVGSEFACNFIGLTSAVYRDFFEIESQTPIQVVQESKEIKVITDYGKNNKTQIESILTEWQDPVKTVPLQFLGGAVK